MIKNKTTLLRADIPSPLYEARKVLIEVLNYTFERCNLDLILKNYTNRIGENPYIISIGKAAYTMLKPFVKSTEIRGGILVTNVKIPEKLNNIKYFKGGHPYPNEASIKSAEYLLTILKTKPPEKLLFLVSGGGSSMFELPRIPLKDLIAINKLLLSSRANIEEINTVRKHLSKIKGGQLINYFKNKAYALLMSDVINDRIDLIASGLTTCDPSTFLDALEVLNKYDLWDKAPKSVKEVISAGIKGDIPETLKDCKLAEEKIENTIILKNADFLAHLEDYLKSLGFAVFNLGSDFHLNIEDMVQILVKKAQELTLQSPHKPIAIVAGGEISLKVIGKGKGGRNQELVLRMAVEMSKFNKTFVFTSLGTDGIDGITDAAGAICDSETMKRAKILNLDPENYLKRNDSYNFFKKIEDLIFTGPTGINVKDVYFLLLLSQQNPITAL